MSIPMRWGSFLALPLPQPGRWYVKDMNALGFPILSVLLAVPLAAALWILFAPGSEAGRAQNARVIALGATLIDFALGILLWLNFYSSTAAFQFQEDVPLFAHWFSWTLGIDGIALMLIQDRKS